MSHLPDCEITTLADGRYLLALETRSDMLGPLTYTEMRAVLLALLEWREDTMYDEPVRSRREV